LEEAHEQFPHDAFLIEDTSLYFDALKGPKGALPGPLIKWFDDTVGNEGLFKIAQCFGNFDATATCIIGYIDAQGHKNYFYGSVEGTIVQPRSIGKGFGWDPIFEPKDQEGSPKKTFAEMDIDEKNRYSMRWQAAVQAYTLIMEG
jgi:non-canonical purine NTP pyrophosphatase (RdgB/HAM1 family)